MARKIHKIKELLIKANAIAEMYNFKIENYILEVSVYVSDKNGLKFWISYKLDNQDWTDYERITGFGRTPEDALNMWEANIQEFLKIPVTGNINLEDFIF